MKHSEHRERIQDQFTRQALPFSQARSMRDDAAIALLLDAAQVQAHHRSLDVACGPGLVALAFAGRVAHATGLDATPAMLARARTLQAERSVSNVSWAQGDACALPFADASFDVVSTRFALHHVERPERMLGEMWRVCKPGGRMVVCDAVTRDDAESAQAFNTLERLRDPSTSQFLSANQIGNLLQALDIEVDAAVHYKVPMELEALMATSFPVPGDDARVRDIIVASVHSDSLGIGAHWKGKQLLFHYPAVIYSARRLAPIKTP